jgi:hypothetical protein
VRVTRLHVTRAVGSEATNTTKRVIVAFHDPPSCE